MTFNQEIFYLSLVLFSFLSILFVIFGYLIFTKTRENKNLAKIEQYKEQYQLPLFYYLKEGKPIREIDELDSLQRVAFIELLASFSKTFDGKEIHHQIQLFAKDHFTSFLRSQLFHRRWSYRMNALYWMEEFRMNHMQSSLIHFLTNTKKLSKGEEIQALKTLILSGNSTVMERLCSSRNELSEFEYSMLFQSLNDNQFNEFITAYKDLPEVMKFALIDSIGVRRETNFVHFLEELTSHEQKEIRIRSLKALASIEHYVEASRLIAFLESPLWEERLMAIKISEYMRKEEFIPPLTTLMKDSSYYVRSQAAQALLRMKNGRELLKTISLTSDDAYARDMAGLWLERSSLA